MSHDHGDEFDDEFGRESMPGLDVVPGLYRWREGDQPTYAIVEAVASEVGCDETELAPLHDTIEADALNDLLTNRQFPGATPLRVSFEYYGFTVLISSDKVIELWPSDAALE
jgi:hypothetical protein